MIAFNKKTDETHLLALEHIAVLQKLEEFESQTLEELSLHLYPNLEPAEAMQQTDSLIQQLIDKQILLTPKTMSRRKFSKAAAAIPAILTFSAPRPAAADSFGVWDSDVDEMGIPDTYTVDVPDGAMSINYTVIGGGGGGGGG